MSVTLVLSWAFEKMTAAGGPTITTPSVLCNLKSGGLPYHIWRWECILFPWRKHCISVRTTGCYITFKQNNLVTLSDWLIGR